jgi:hypothetical protein
MPAHSVGLRIISTWLVVSLGSVAGLSAWQSSASTIALPGSVPLADVEIRWQSGGGDGCAGDCTNYRITLRGDGLVSLEELGWGNKPPKSEARQRSIPADDVVALINELLRLDSSRLRTDSKGLRT